MENVANFRMENELISSHKFLTELEKKYGASFYLLNVDKLRENYKKIEYAFQSRYDQFIIGYSYKTNYVPFVCKQLKNLGAHAEVVSRLEYDLAIKIGVDPKKVIFNGPLKNKEDIYYALENESKINLDSQYEINFVEEYARNNPNRKVKVGLRVNFDLSENGESPLVEGHEVSRFGICLENGDFDSAMNKLSRIKNVQISGLHGHFSTSMRKVETFQKITQVLCNLAKEYTLTDLDYIDIGGGFFGEVPKILIENTPTFEEYAEAVCTVMNNEFGHYKTKPNLIIEPGISMVANVFQFVAKVIDTKSIKDHNFVLVDGSVHNIKPTMHKKNLPMKIVRQDSVDFGNNEDFHIVGYTCLEKDYLAYNFHEKIPKTNDYIIFENVGAYTIVFNPSFIKEKPGIVAIENNRISEVRKKETLRQFFNEEIYIF
nr:diaminopimelate decarboxylase [Bacillus sp. MRMR6]